MSSVSRDTCSCGNFSECTIRNLDLTWEVNFETKIISGNVVLQVEFLKETNKVCLDTRDLKIGSVTTDGEDLEFTLKPCDFEPFGSELEIKFSEPVKVGTHRNIHIDYQTSPSASALQWMSPEQTADKKAPFMFSQCQAIHARSLFPCMDTPAVKQSYNATVTVPNDVVALMSAVPCDRPSLKSEAGKHSLSFRQKVPIPSYLVAIVVGALESRDVSERTAVWAEASIVDAAAYEFAETEKMLQTAELLLGEYVWGRYDLLILPPSFPYGGMENPCLSFITPSLLAGDRSLTGVIAHELTHSWTGNLVTNATWEHFWLNEGFTTYVERKIIGKLSGEARRQFDSYNGWNTRLKSSVFEQLGPEHRFTKLVLDSEQYDPDDSFSGIPYEKGSAFLLYLEQKVGGAELMDKFLRAYVEKYKYKTLTTNDWKEFFLDHFSGQAKNGAFDSVDWNGWLYSPGMPPDMPKFDTSLSDACAALCRKWADGDQKTCDQFDREDFDALDALQKTDFLAKLLEEQKLSHYKIEKMNKLYGLDETNNCEILFYWIRVCIKAEWPQIIDKAIAFVTKHGRMKFCRPVYRDLGAWPLSRAKAESNFRSVRASMHGISAEMVAKDLKISD